MTARLLFTFAGAALLGIAEVTAMRMAFDARSWPLTLLAALAWVLTTTLVTLLSINGREP